MPAGPELAELGLRGVFVCGSLQLPEGAELEKRCKLHVADGDVWWRLMLRPKSKFHLEVAHKTSFWGAEPTAKGETLAEIDEWLGRFAGAEFSGSASAHFATDSGALPKDGNVIGFMTLQMKLESGVSIRMSGAHYIVVDGDDSTRIHWRIGADKRVITDVSRQVNLPVTSNMLTSLAAGFERTFSEVILEGVSGQETSSPPEGRADEEISVDE